MGSLFADRRDAGRHLGARLAGWSFRDPIVLALPRGGVPVGFEVAKLLGAPLDVFVVRKLGVPGHEELAMGAIASGGVRVLVPETVRAFALTNVTIDAVTEIERQELARRERAYRGERPFPSLTGKTAIVVDDGIATGASMIAAVKAVRALNPAKIVAAAPVMSDRARAEVAKVADVCEAAAVPEPFFSVGGWYANFAQTEDDEVRSLLEAAERTRGAHLLPDGVGEFV